MMFGLCGNKNVERILLFLFVNTKCYGTQLQRILGVPLTSIQNALNRLEKSDIITPYLEGKTKVYQMNPAYPLVNELEILLKRAYTLLAPHEKRLYALVQQEGLEKRVQQPRLLAFWARLKGVRHFTLYASSRSQSEMGWNGKGKGEVLVDHTKGQSLIFHERGTWQHSEGKGLDFSNTYRWTLDLNAGMISLEHLRLGWDQPVFLFHLVPTGAHTLASVDAQLCEEDTYLAQVPWDRASIRLNWRVIGPKKNEEMEYCYL